MGVEGESRNGDFSRLEDRDGVVVSGMQLLMTQKNATQN